MKALFFAIVMIAQTAFADVSTKTLVFCDYGTETESIFMDLYFDYDAAKDVYSTPEMGVVVDETSAYPDYLWNVTASYTGTEAAITTEKNGNTINFSLVASADQSIVLNKTNGFVDNFSLPFQAMYNGVAVNAEFSCYDPAAQAPQEGVVR